MDLNARLRLAFQHFSLAEAPAAWVIEREVELQPAGEATAAAPDAAQTGAGAQPRKAAGGPAEPTAVAAASTARARPDAAKWEIVPHPEPPTGRIRTASGARNVRSAPDRAGSGTGGGVDPAGTPARGAASPAALEAPAVPRTDAGPGAHAEASPARNPTTGPLPVAPTRLPCADAAGSSAPPRSRAAAAPTASGAPPAAGTRARAARAPFAFDLDEIREPPHSVGAAARAGDPRPARLAALRGWLRSSHPAPAGIAQQEPPPDAVRTAPAESRAGTDGPPLTAAARPDPERATRAALERRAEHRPARRPPADPSDPVRIEHLVLDFSAPELAHQARARASAETRAGGARSSLELHRRNLGSILIL